MGVDPVDSQTISSDNVVIDDDFLFVSLVNRRPNANSNRARFPSRPKTIKVIIELLVNLLCHDVRPVDHAGAKVEINGTRTASLVDDRHHRIVVVQSNFADVRFVGEQQRSMAFHSSRKCIGFYVSTISLSL